MMRDLIGKLASYRLIGGVVICLLFSFLIGCGSDSDNDSPYPVPQPSPCTYAYSEWGDCQVDSTQVRTVISEEPTGCEGEPILIQDCTYVPPTPEPETEPEPTMVTIAPNPYIALTNLIPTGTQQRFTLEVKDSNGRAVPFSVLNKTGDWFDIDVSVGKLSYVVDSDNLAIGNYSGSITVNLEGYDTRIVPVKVRVIDYQLSTSVTVLKPYEIEYYSYNPGYGRFFSFNVVNGTNVQFHQMDMTQGRGLGDVDMIVKFGSKPTFTEYKAAKSGQIKSGTNDLYFRLSTDAFETVSISSKVGTYYIMVVNASNIVENSISIKGELTQ